MRGSIGLDLTVIEQTTELSVQVADIERRFASRFAGDRATTELTSK